MDENYCKELQRTHNYKAGRITHERETKMKVILIQVFSYQLQRKPQEMPCRRICF